MMNSRTIVESLSASDLRSATRELVRTSHGLDAALLVHLGEIDERKLYLDWTFSSMFAFCVGELGFSEDVACNRLNVARAARRMPVILEALRSGKVHLAGLRARAAPDHREPGEGVGRGCRQVETPDRRAGRASCAAAACTDCRAQASGSPQRRARVSHIVSEEGAICHRSEASAGFERRGRLAFSSHPRRHQ